MVSSKIAFGLRPNNSLGGANYGEVRKFRVGTSTGEDIGYHDPVMLASAGLVKRASGSPAHIVGSALQFMWTDPITLVPQFSNRVLAGTSTASGTFIEVLVHADTHATFIIQADSSLSVTDIGLSFGLSAVGSVNATYGNSKAVLEVGTRSTAASAAVPLRVLRLVEYADNAINDAFPIVEVALVNNGLGHAVSAT